MKGTEVMQKILTVKLIVFIAVFVLSPGTLYTVLPQQDDPFEMEAEDWSDEFLDEEPLDEEPELDIVFEDLEMLVLDPVNELRLEDDMLLDDCMDCSCCSFSMALPRA